MQPTESFDRRPQKMKMSFFVVKESQKATKEKYKFFSGMGKTNKVERAQIYTGIACEQYKKISVNEFKCGVAFWKTVLLAFFR